MALGSRKWLSARAFPGFPGRSNCPKTVRPCGIKTAREYARPTSLGRPITCNRFKPSRPMRNEWGESWREGFSSSPRPSPPAALGGEGDDRAVSRSPSCVDIFHQFSNLATPLGFCAKPKCLNNVRPCEQRITCNRFKPSRPMRNEWGESWREGFSSSPRPSPPAALGGEEDDRAASNSVGPRNIFRQFSNFANLGGRPKRLVNAAPTVAL
jgi:hypothetical protein